MDLTERDLGAVRWNPPAGKADDIVEELAELIARAVGAIAVGQCAVELWRLYRAR